MTEPLNPNTILPMSLEVDKIRQVKQLHAGQQHGLMSQKLEDEKGTRENRVNNKENPEQAKIGEENGGGQSRRNKEREREEDKEEQKKRRDGIKGKYLDIKV